MPAETLLEATEQDAASIASHVATKLAQGAKITANDLQSLKGLVDTSALPRLDRSYLSQGHSNTRLVRHVGMVQDMLEPEYYLGECNGQSMHFRDVGTTESEPDLSALASQLHERQPLVVVPLPYCSQWFESQVFPRSSESPKAVVIPESPPNEASKRKRDWDDNAGHTKAKTCSEEPSQMMDQDPLQGQELDWWPSGCCDSPKDQSPVLAKLYYDQYQKDNRLRLNDLVEMIGVVSTNPWEANDGDDFDLPLPPPSRLPRFHVLSFRRLELDHVMPVNEPPVSLDALAANLLGDWAERLYSNQVATLLAEALSVTLLSKAERVKNGAMQRGPQHAVGCASLQITSEGDSELLYRHLSDLLHQVCPVVATVDLTKDLALPPTKETGRLVPSPWQLPRGSTIVIHAGSSIPATRDFVHDLINQHRAPYTFEGGMRVPFDADYRVILVGGTSSCTLQLPLPAPKAVIPTVETRLVEQLRRALCRARTINNVGLSKTVLEQAQESFLQRRAHARTKQLHNPQEADFHRWLTLTRLQARARQVDTATCADWESALQLDDSIRESA